MPTLPDYTALGERPTPQAPQGTAAYEPPNWRQVGVAGQDVSGAGRDMMEASNIVAAASDAQDQKTALDAANQLKAAQLGLEQDPNSGFLRVKGSGVVGQQFTDTYQGKFKDAQSQIADTLTNQNQKNLFDQHAQVLGLQYQSALLQHQAKETTAFNATTRNDTINLGLNDIAAHPYDENTYQTNQLLMGKTVVDAGKDLGLNGDALANYVRVGTNQLQSKALMYRTSGMLLDNPMKAADFFRQHELEFDPQDRMHLAGTIRTTTDAQTTRIGGQQAYKMAVGTPSTSALPADRGADLVRPYSVGQINQVADLVNKPSVYDELFQKYGQAYNVSPTELKMRAAVESGINANTPDSSQGAVGLMQFTPDTAKRFGIDPKDPEQAIAGAAKLMAQAGGTIGGDMSQVDRTYYGGNANAKGPNTDQYVENMRVLRQKLMGATQQPLTAAYLEGREGAVIDNARTWAQSQRPNDAVFEDQTIAEARKNWSMNLQAIKGQDYANFSSVMDAVVTGGAQSISDLSTPLQQTLSKLSPQNYISVREQFKRNESAARGEFTQSDPRLVNDLTQRIYLNEGDPNKIAQPGDLSQYMGKGLNYTDHQRLVKEITDANTPEGSPFLKQVASVKETGRKMLTGSMSALAVAHPELADEAAYRFGLDAEAQIRAARAAGTDPQALLTPGSKGYLLDPNRVAGFMPTEAQIAARKAQAIAAPTKVAPRMPGESVGAYLSRTAPS